MILLNKRPGVTSFQALYPLKREYGTVLGHTGTLDQFAQGLLVVLTGKFTKFTPFFTDFDKVYEADFTFGRETTTLDPEGTTVSEGPVPPLESLLSYANQFRGVLNQVPPQYSAVHIDGKRAYQRVRDGESPEIPPRAITVHELDVVRWANPVLTLRVHCSKGTYIRSLARDWGRLAGCGAFVSRLIRHRVGPFSLPEQPQVFMDEHETLKILDIPLLEVRDLDGVSRGLDPLRQSSELMDLPQERAALVDSAGRLGAVVERRAGRWSYVFVQAALP
ncbi:MAG: tRNA pseudouridine(55) synthase TruB [Spirochaetales bacterium]